MNKNIKAYIFSIVACLMINTCLFAGKSYTRHQAINIILNSLSSPTKQVDIAITMMDEILSEKAEKIDEGMISQEELDEILEESDEILSRSTYHVGNIYRVPNSLEVLFLLEELPKLYRSLKEFDENLTD